MKKVIDKFDHTLTKIEENLVFMLMFFMLGIVFVSVLNRFIIGDTFRWSEELARYLMIWASFVGASLGVKKGSHISVDALVTFLPNRLKAVVEIFSNVISLTFCVVILYIGIPFILALLNNGQLSPSLRIPMYIAYLSVPVGFFLMAIRYILLIINQVTEGKHSSESDLESSDHPARKEEYAK